LKVLVFRALRFCAPAVDFCPFHQKIRLPCFSPFLVPSGKLIISPCLYNNAEISPPCEVSLCLRLIGQFSRRVGLRWVLSTSFFGSFVCSILPARWLFLLFSFFFFCDFCRFPFSPLLTFFLLPPSAFYLIARLSSLLYFPPCFSSERPPPLLFASPLTVPALLQAVVYLDTLFSPPSPCSYFFLLNCSSYLTVLCNVPPVDAFFTSVFVLALVADFF